MSNFKNKYLKYKIKYINLKNEMEGGFNLKELQAAKASLKPISPGIPKPKKTPPPISPKPKKTPPPISPKPKKTPLPIPDPKPHTVSTPGGAAASPPPITPMKNIGYDFDGVLHRTMKWYERRGPGLYQGHPDFHKDPSSYQVNRNISNDAKKHIQAGHNVYIITRSPSDKMNFLNINSITLGNYFRENPKNIIVVPMTKSKADIIKSLNITKFVEDSSSELQNISENTTGVDLFFVNTWETFKSNTEPSMMPFVPITPGGAAAPKISIGYDFDGVLHRTMKSYQYKGPGLYQGHPDFHKDPSSYQVNRNISNDAKKHIQAGHNVYIITRSPSDKMNFLNINSITLGNYFRENPKNIIVVPMTKSKADIIKSLNITKFVEDSSSELQNISENTTGVDLFFVNTWETFKSNTEPSMMPFVPLTPGGGAAAAAVTPVVPPAGVPPGTDTINVLSYNVLYKSFTMAEKNNFGRNIIGYINKNYKSAEKPDIMVLLEASPLVPNHTIGESKWYPKINLPNYNTNIHYLAKRGSGGTIIYWSNKFRKDTTVNDTGLNICESSVQKGHTKRPCIGVKLIHNTTGKKYIIIGVHYGHKTRPDIVTKGINEILTNLNYTNEQIIIMGDHNEFFERHKIHQLPLKGDTLLDLKTINPDTGVPYNTCCGNEFAPASQMIPSGTGIWARPFDLAYSNIPSLQMKVDITILPSIEKAKGAKPYRNSTHSDHYPIIGTFTI